MGPTITERQKAWSTLTHIGEEAITAQLNGQADTGPAA